MSPAALAWARDLKRSIDPGNIFGIGNQCMSRDQTASASGPHDA
jgi:hypothetical protein